MGTVQPHFLLSKQGKHEEVLDDDDSMDGLTPVVCCLHAHPTNTCVMVLVMCVLEVTDKLRSF